MPDLATEHSKLLVNFRRPIQATVDATPLEQGLDQLQSLFEHRSELPAELIDCLVGIVKSGDNLACIEPNAAIRAGKVVLTLKLSDRLTELLAALGAGKGD